jgi:hypothetical protein
VYEATAIAIDATGNRSTASPIFTFEVDITPPPAPVITSPVPPTVLNNPTLVEGSCTVEAADGTVSITTTPTGGLVPDPTVFDLDENGDFSGIVTWAAGADGNAYTLNLTCSDGGGNPGPTTPV